MLKEKENLNNSLLAFKWSVSRGRDTYGYNIVTLRLNSKKVSSCNGGGYDMTGACLGNWITYAFKDELSKFKFDEKGKSEFYGLNKYDNNIYCDGACGFSSMEAILKELGYYLKCVNYSTNLQEYILLSI